jgi:hypothetical protein
MLDTRAGGGQSPAEAASYSSAALHVIRGLMMVSQDRASQRRASSPDQARIARASAAL